MCVCACVRACVCAGVRVCVHVCDMRVLYSIFGHTYVQYIPKVHVHTCTQVIECNPLHHTITTNHQGELQSEGTGDTLSLS